MLNFDVKRKINSLRDILVGKVPDPKAQVEQITIALIYKFMDDMDLDAMEFGAEREFFKGDYKKYAWTELMSPQISGTERVLLYGEGIKKMQINPDIPSLFRDMFKGAFLPYRDPETLNMFLKEINEFKYDHSEDLGNAFEYLLSIMGSQGDAGQFRTPRHIIDMMVEIIEPDKRDSVLDPACGTAGFLISSYKHILNDNLDKDGNSTLTADDRNRLTANFTGYDISPDMVRLSRVNMYLHKFAQPKIYEYDTLTSLDKWDDQYDIILANPPFMTPKGGIIPHNRFRVQAKRSEVLFVDYIAEHLNPNGKAAVIVPEGIVFQSANAYKDLRKFLVEDRLLYAVISLPAGLFNPYSGVKTSILLFDKAVAKNTDNILFVKLENDGFDLGAQRRVVKGSGIPDVVELVKKYKNVILSASEESLKNEIENNPFATLATKKQVAKQDYILVGERYKETVIHNTVYPLMELGEVAFEIRNGTNVEQIDEIGKYRVTRIQTIADGTLDLEKTKWTVDEPAESYFMAEGDILLSHINSYEHLGKAAIFEDVSEKVVHGINLIRFRLNKDLINPKYAIRCMKSAVFINTVKSFAQRAVNQASVKTSDLRKIKIPLPPLTVQEQIVAEIEGYQRIIDGARQVVENYKPTIKIEPEWEMVDLKDIVNIKTGKIDVNRAVKNGQYPFFTCAKEPYYIDEYAYDCEALLLAGNNATADYDVKYYSGKFNAYQRTYIITINNKEKVEYSYLKTIMESNLGLLKSNSIGSQTKYLTLGVIQLLKIPLPPIETQQQIVAKINEEQKSVDECKKLIATFEQKISDKINAIWGE